MMNSHIRTLAKSAALSIWALALAVGPVLAQDPGSPDTTTNSYAPPAKARLQLQPIQIGYFRAHDARGINVFEPPKREGAAYEGFRIQWGAAFTQQFQALRHHNTADPVLAGAPPVNVNQLIRIGSGFNNAEANLYMDTQLGRGIRVALTSYLSSRHHNET